MDPYREHHIKPGDDLQRPLVLESSGPSGSPYQFSFEVRTSISKVHAFFGWW